MDAKEAVRRRLPPGFRFRPTDEELIVHYLRRRAFASPLPAAVDIPDIRILAHDPSDLLPPGWNEPERYFFTCKEAKYVKGRRANRATGAGYWKATGKEKPVAVAAPGGNQAVLVGMKRSLVFYRGRPPSGSKTDWVMHEYRLAGAGLAPCRRAQAGEASRADEGWVLCRVFRKRGSSASDGTAAEADADADADERGAEEEGEGDDAAPASGFIDFFARADRQRRRRASSPVVTVSSSCLTDASHECRDQDTTSGGCA